jgi:methionyl-tRNA formyltransferase
MHDLLAADGAPVVLRVLDEFAHGRAQGHAQDESLVTHARKLSKADGVINPAWPAEQIRRTVHGLTPWPGVGAILDGAPMKLLRVQDLSSHPESGAAPVGALVDPKAGVVACGQGTALRLLEVQPLGKRAMRWDEYASGKRFSDSGRLEAAPC